MTQLEYNKTKIAVPDSWADITLGHYETFYNERPQTARERVALIAKVCKVEADLLLGWPAEVFNVIVEKLGFIFKDDFTTPSPTVTVGGATYTVPIEDALSLGAWVDADEVQRNEENVLTGILAIVCRPPGEAYDYKNNEERRAMFAALPVSEVLGVLAFFLRCKAASDQRTAAYTNLTQAFDLLPRNIGPFLNPGGGIRLSRIWQMIRYRGLMILLSYRLRKCLPSFNTAKTKVTQTKHNTN